MSTRPSQAAPPRAHRLSRGWRLALPLSALVALHLACLFGGFLAPNSAITQDRRLPWAPPTKLRFVDAEGRFHLRPFVYPLEPDPVLLDLYHEDRSRRSHLRFFVRGDEYRLLGLFPTDVHFLGVPNPGKLLFLGSDNFGRDVFARLLVGGRISLFAGLVAAAIALTIGTAFGALAGFYGGRIDILLMRLVELFLALPWLYLLLGVRAFLPLNFSLLHAFFLLTLTLGCLGWPAPARLIRGVALTARQTLFVAAARSTGSPDPKILRFHILPQISAIILTQGALLPPRYTLAEVTLSFLGLGTPPPHPSWGTLLSQLQDYAVLNQIWWFLAPVLALLLLFFLFHLLQPKLALLPSFKTDVKASPTITTDHR